MATENRLKIYRTSDLVPDIVPASMSRKWMRETTLGFAHRCLPLKIACGQGWQVNSFLDFAAVWNGGDAPEDVEIISNHPHASHYVNAHFGYGTFTFINHFLVSTPADVDLAVTGPVNEPRDAVQALAGVMECDWMPMSFTMNWKCTRPYEAIYFMRGEPYMQMYLLPRGYGEDFEVSVHDLDEHPDKEGYLAWSKSRDRFHEQIRTGEIDAMKKGWQGDYTRGARRKVTRYQKVKHDEL